MRWNLIKGGFSRGIDARARSRSKVMKREKGVWQRRYWEHAIRDDADLERHVDYIHFNPVRHGHVTRVADWPHSSFDRFVDRGLLAPDWGSDPRPSHPAPRFVTIGRNVYLNEAGCGHKFTFSDFQQSIILASWA